jgi:hypothetical protein
MHYEDGWGQNLQKQKIELKLNKNLSHLDDIGLTGVAAMLKIFHKLI